MRDLITIQMPTDVQPDDVSALADDLCKWQDVDDAGTDEVRAPDAATIGLWVQTLTGVISAVGTAVPLIKHLFAELGRRGVRTATIELPNGVKVTREMDDAELERLVRLSTVGEADPQQ
jgi:hypothetical protein